jgi:hypothetical protein
MTNHMERPTRVRIKYLLAGIALAALILTGVLFGWFRVHGMLTPEQWDTLAAAQFNQEADAAGAEQRFAQLWQEHASRTRALINAEFNKSDDFVDRVSFLRQNHQDIANAVNGLYPGSGETIAVLLHEHGAASQTVFNDLRNLRLARLPSDINAWYASADRLGAALKRLNPKWDMRGPIHAYVRSTERQALYRWLGMREFSSSVFRTRIEPQAQELAKRMGEGVHEAKNE